MKFVKELFDWLRHVGSSISCSIEVFTTILILHAFLVAIRNSFKGTVLLLLLVVLFGIVSSLLRIAGMRFEKPCNSEEEIKKSYKDVISYNKFMVKCLLFLYLGIVVATSYMTYGFAKPSHNHWVNSIQELNKDVTVVSESNIWVLECLPACVQKSLVVKLDCANYISEIRETGADVDNEAYSEYILEVNQILDSCALTAIVTLIMWLATGALKHKIDRCLEYHTKLKEFRDNNDSDSISE